MAWPRGDDLESGEGGVNVITVLPLPFTAVPLEIHYPVLAALLSLLLYKPYGVDLSE